MKKYLASLIAFVAIFSACENNSVNPLIDDGSAVSSINHFGGDINWFENFEYDDQGKLVSIEDLRGTGQRKIFEYEGSQLLETRTYEVSEDKLIFRDSMSYNSSGQVDAIYKFSTNAGPDLPISSIEHLSYDDQGQVTEIRRENLRFTDNNQRIVYHWQNGNIVQEDQYWNGQELSLEFYFTYDKGRAINSKGIIGVQHNELPTRNNVTSVDWTDHTGLYDTACKPCNTSYSYDVYNRPITLSTSWGYSATISYIQLAPGQ